VEESDAQSIVAMADLIGPIYDCALDPARWPDVLAEIGRRLGFCQVTLTLQAMPSGAVMLNVASGISDSWLERSTVHGADVIAMWGGLARIAATPLEEPILLSDMNPGLRDGSVSNAFHSEWYRPQGLADTAAVGLTRDATSLASISLTRHEDQGPICPTDVGAIRVLAPHLRRAVTISRLLDAQTLASATFGTVLDRIGTPIVITDGQLRLLHANDAARRLLDARDPIAVNGQQLATNQPTVTQALALAVAQAAEDEAQIGRRGLAIPLSGKEGVPRVLHVLPLRSGALRAGLVNQAAAAIFVSTTLPSLADSGALAAQLFGLSAGEVRVFDLIAEGLTPSEAADRLGIGISTVRTHLLHIFDKTGTRRQSDLVRLAASLALQAG
jgi:DNA-binding CsgD family transcriptional regulator/PAS domain-containing protein